MTEDKMSAPASHWRRRQKSTPIPQDQATRQGDITRLAFVALGKDAAISFLNTEQPTLGGRPLAIATATKAGEAEVTALLQEIAAMRSPAAPVGTPSWPGPAQLQRMIARDAPVCLSRTAAVRTSFSRLPICRAGFWKRGCSNVSVTMCSRHLTAANREL